MTSTRLCGPLDHQFLRNPMKIRHTVKDDERTQVLHVGKGRSCIPRARKTAFLHTCDTKKLPPPMSCTRWPPSLSAACTTRRTLGDLEEARRKAD